MRNNFPERLSGAPLHILSKLYVPVGFVNPLFETVYCFFSITEGCLLLDIE